MAWATDLLPLRRQLAGERTKREQAPALQKNGQPIYRLACLFPGPYSLWQNSSARKSMNSYLRICFDENRGNTLEFCQEFCLWDSSVWPASASQRENPRGDFAE